MALSITVNSDSSTGIVTIGFTNISPPDSLYLNKNGVRISSTIPPSTPFTEDSFFFDYQVEPGKLVTYSAGSITSGQETATAAPKSTILTLNSAWIHKVTRGATSNISDDLPALELFNQEGQQTTRSRESNILQLASVEKPRIKTASQTQRIIECPIIIRQQDRATVMPVLEEILWSNDLFCFKEPMGELIFCTIPSQENDTDLNTTMTLVLWESDYNEGI